MPHERGVAAARTHLDAAIFAAAWAEGQALPIEQVVAVALQRQGPRADSQEYPP